MVNFGPICLFFSAAHLLEGLAFIFMDDVKKFYLWLNKAK